MDIENPQGRLARWITRLTAFDVEFVYRKGECNESTSQVQTYYHYQDWADSVNPTLLETHIAPLLGDKTTLRDPGRSNARIWRPSHISVACQNATGSSQPYSRAGWSNDDCRFAAWRTLVNKGVFTLLSWLAPAAQ